MIDLEGKRAVIIKRSPCRSGVGMTCGTGNGKYFVTFSQSSRVGKLLSLASVSLISFVVGMRHEDSPCRH
jgi:hypothetical protein